MMNNMLAVSGWWSVWLVLTILGLFCFWVYFVAAMEAKPPSTIPERPDLRAAGLNGRPLVHVTSGEVARMEVEEFLSLLEDDAEVKLAEILLNDPACAGLVLLQETGRGVLDGWERLDYVHPQGFQSWEEVENLDPAQGRPVAFFEIV